MFSRGDMLKQIEEDLAILTVRVKISNSQGRTDVNSHAEDFYCGLLNIILNCNLENLNLMEMNFAAIDLADRKGRLCVQVTSTEGRTKVDKTLEKFFEKGLQEEYDRLIVLIMGEKPDYRKDFTVVEGFVFEPDRDVWDTAKLVNEIAGLPDEKLEMVAQYLQKQLKIPRRAARVMNLPLQSGMAAKNFVGREKELRELAQRFEQDKIVVLSGLGGMGKTELAVRFGREYEESGRGWAYFLYFSGSFSATVRSNVTGIIPGYSPEGKPEELIVADALAALNRCGKGDLLILDNADEGSITALRRELSALQMRVLVTSRKAVPGAVKVEPLSNDALYAVFELNNVNISKEEMDALIGAVNAHTLTVDVMARTMGRGRRSATPEKMLAALKERDLSKGFTKVEIDYAGSPEQARINEHLKAVFRVAELEEESQVLLRCATLLPEGGMDDGLFLSPFIEEAGDWLDDLIEGGWLYMKDGLLRIHPVIRIVCIEVLEPTEEKCEDFLIGIQRKYDPKQYSTAKFRQMAELFETAANTLEDPECRWALLAGHFWGALGESVKALECNKGAVRRLEIHGTDSELLAGAYNNLGTTYGDLGDSQKELEYLLKAMEILERRLDRDHPILVRCCDNVGGTYGKLGEHKKALEYRLKALETFVRVLSADHPDLAISYDNVGKTYGDLGDHGKALEYQQKAMEIRERMLGVDHPSLANSYNNVGGTYGKLGDHKKELEYLMKALNIRERVLPGNHPDLASSLSNIAFAYGCLDDFLTAVGYIRQAVEIAEKRLPEGHPDLENYREGRKLIEMLALMQKLGLEFINPFKK